MLLSQRPLARAKRLLVACELVMANLLEDAPEVLVTLDVLLRDVTFLAHGGRFELVVAVAEDHRPVLALEDVDQLARRRARDERVLDEVQRTAVVDGEVGGQFPLLLPAEDLYPLHEEPPFRT